ncbi:MAG: hypothetical protein AAFN11_02395 [Chloroflexota bacterium]
MPDETPQIPEDNENTDEHVADVLNESDFAPEPVPIEVDLQPEEDTIYPVPTPDDADEIDVPVSDTLPDDMESVLDNSPQPTLPEEAPAEPEAPEDDIIAITETETSTSRYPSPNSTEPDWKRVARELREEREASERALIEERKQRDREVAEEFARRKAKLREERAEHEKTYLEEFRKKEAEKQNAVEEMMQKAREEREQREADIQERTTGRRFTYPKPAPKEINYPNPSELRRREDEQPIPTTSSDRDERPSPPAPPRNTDFDSRISRLAKPDTESADTDAEETPPADDTPDTPDE